MIEKKFYRFMFEESIVSLLDEIPPYWGNIDGHLLATARMMSTQYVLPYVAFVFGREPKRGYRGDVIAFDGAGEWAYESRYAPDSDEMDLWHDAPRALQNASIHKVLTEHKLPLNIFFEQAGAGRRPVCRDEAERLGERERQKDFALALDHLKFYLTLGYRGFFMMGSVESATQWQDDDIEHATWLAVSHPERLLTLGWNTSAGGAEYQLAPVEMLLPYLGFEEVDRGPSFCEYNKLTLDNVQNLVRMAYLLNVQGMFSSPARPR